MKLSFAILLIILCMPFALSYRLVDSETFSPYTPWAFGGSSERFINESFGKWNCSETAWYPECANPFGGDDFASGVGAFNIGYESGNNYLAEFATNGDCTDGDGQIDYWKIGLNWNHANTSTLSSFPNGSRFIMQYRIRVIQGGTGMGVCGNAGDSYFSRFQTANIVNTSRNLVTGVGGNAQCSPYSDACFNGLRNMWDTTRMQPTNHYCNVSDGAWHDVKLVYYVNASYFLTRWASYIDNVVCEDYNVSINKGAATHFFVNNPGVGGDKIQTTGVFSTYWDNLALYEANESENFLGLDLVENASSTCDSVSLPYYLKESFNGQLSQCNWTTSFDYTFAGSLDITELVGYWYAQKDFTSPFDGTVLSSANSRYVSMTYTFKITNVMSGMNTELRLYDNSGVNLVHLFTLDNDLYVNENGVASVVYNNLNLGQTYSIKVVIDLQGNTYDVYVDGTLVGNDKRFVNQFYDADNVFSVKISSNAIAYTIDNLYIFTSDSTGNAVIGNTAQQVAAATALDNETLFCNLFYKATPACVNNTQCSTGACIRGHCASFDYNYCDENGYTRGQKCMFGAVTSCAFSSVTSIIFDNFLWVLIFIAILVVVVYLKILLTRR